MCYDINGNSIVYFINASYRGASLGIDVEDEIIGREIKRVKNCKIEIKQYQVLETGDERISAQFVYNKLEYFLIGTMNEDDLDKIIKNFHFPS